MLTEVIEYFDARMIGLTATPANFIERDTFRLFGCDANVPTFLYDYPQAVKEHFLVDFTLYQAHTSFQRKGWHRAGFRLYWKWLSRARRIGGRTPVGKEIRELIFRMAAENPTWGAPRIHGELLKLGFTVSEPTVSRWLQRVPRSPDVGKRWLTFLQNHRDAIAAMDF
jgi:hypothetical protein